MITKKQKTKLKRLINLYADWYAEKILMGGSDPDDWDEIEANYQKAKKNLNNFIKEISEKV